MSRLKADNRSEHHGILRQMRLKYEGEWTLNNGSRFHRFEFRNMHNRWPQTALGKLKSYLGAAGFVPGDTNELIDNNGRIWHRTYAFSRGEEQIRIHAYGASLHQPEERVERVDHFPHGTAGDGRSGVTVDQIINAMSWGCA